MIKKILSMAISSMMTLAVCQNTIVYASDIDIYKGTSGTDVTLLMMIDISGSMATGRNFSLTSDYGLSENYKPKVANAPTINEQKMLTKCYKKTGTSVNFLKTFDQLTNTEYDTYPEYDTVIVTTSNPKVSYKYNRPYCEVDLTDQSLTEDAKNAIKAEDGTGCVKQGNGRYRCYTRLSKVQDALIKVLNSNKFTSSDEGGQKYRIGLGAFPYRKDNSDDVTYGGVHGAILVHAAPMTKGQIDKLKEAITNRNKMKPRKLTPTAMAYFEAGGYMMGKTLGGLTGDASIGFDHSKEFDSDVATGNTYNSPLIRDNPPDAECRGQGIYYFTDGIPAYGGTGQNGTTDYSAEHELRKTAAKKLYDASLLNSTKEKTSGLIFNTKDKDDEWALIAAYAKTLNDDKTTVGVPYKVDQLPIKTALVGFSNDFFIFKKYDIKVLDRNNKPVTKTFYDCTSGSATADITNGCFWGSKNPLSNWYTPPELTDADEVRWSDEGQQGTGGFYPVKTVDDVVESIFGFIEDLAASPPGVVAGVATIPQDQLLPLQTLPYAYYSMFSPETESDVQLWLGDLNKYHVVFDDHGVPELYGDDGHNNRSTERLIDPATGLLNKNAKGIWSGVLAELPLGNKKDATISQRKVYTNRTINSKNEAKSSPSLNTVSLDSLFYNDGLFINDPKKNYWYNVLGYNISPTATNVTLASLVATPSESLLRQLGMTLHSDPLLLTQEGKIDVDTDGNLTTSNRKDYVLFGSTDGILHVVDADDGKEVFAFVPNEMMEKFPSAFLKQDSTSGGKSKLFYGIDGAWSAHTQYVSKADGTLTIGNSGRKVDEVTGAGDLNGHQYVYGGLRMGGRSYYGLDLSDIEKPLLMFHIDPDSMTSVPLNYMGQSWSKPSLAYVNWGGKKKLVMFVGGGYDVGYENPTYDQTSQIGAGVYMFDAENGNLLWWSSANVTTTTASTENSENTIVATKQDDLKYSVVSQINTIDRNNDGLVDHLYFGDLGGQVFRVDIDNTVSTKGGFVRRVEPIYKGHLAGGLSPRFYEMPSFSVHTDNVSKNLFGVVALSSGNRSSPLIEGATNSADDGIFVIYDNDVVNHNLYASSYIKSRTTTSLQNLALGAVDTNYGIPLKKATDVYNLGWKYAFSPNLSGKVGRYKGVNGFSVITNFLYAAVYDKYGTGISGKCGSGVKGDTYLYQFCLPYGECPFDLSTGGSSGSGFDGSASYVPNHVRIGVGIHKPLLSNTGFVVSNETDCADETKKNNIECQKLDTTLGVRVLSWYEH